MQCWQFPFVGWVLLVGVGQCGRFAAADDAAVTVSLVGRHRDDVIVTPVNQELTPTGVQVELPGMRPQAMALSPQRDLLLVSGKTSELVMIDPDSGQVLGRVDLPSEDQQTPVGDSAADSVSPDRNGQVSYTGLVFSPDGKSVYLSNVNGSIKVFRVGNNRQIVPSHSWRLPPAHAPRRAAEIPSGLAFHADGARLLVCGNLSNRLLELDAQDGTIVAEFDVGVAPYDVVVAGDWAFVSNWGGRRPAADDGSRWSRNRRPCRSDSVYRLAKGRFRSSISPAVRWSRNW